MDTLAFLAKVMPLAGKRVMAVLTASRRGDFKYWVHTSYDTNEALVEAVVAANGKREAVYFAVNGFGDWYEQEVDGETKLRIRTQENVVACRSLYDDIDTDKPGAYADVPEALRAVLAAVEQGLPEPMIVFSGNGLHLYWPMQDDVTPEVWEHMAAVKRAATTALGLRVDHAVDEDTARVLRPIGTTNHKHAKPMPVKLLRDVQPYRREDLLYALSKVAERGGVPVEQQGAAMFFGTSDLITKVEYPPSHALQILDRCPALQEIVAEPARVVEPQWRAMLGLVKYTVDGRVVAHEWSKGHPGYSASDTDSKYDRWTAAPATCNEFSKFSQACLTCEYRGKIKSPISLGYMDEIEAPAKAEPEAEGDDALTFDETDDEPADDKQFMPKGFGMINNRLCRAVKDENGVVNWTPIASAWFAPVMQVRDAEGQWMMRFHMRFENKLVNTFEIPAKALGTADALAGFLAANRITLFGRNGKYHIMDYTSSYLHHLMRTDQEMQTYDSYGWVEGFNGFVLGDKLITAEGEVTILNGDRLKDSPLGGDLGVRGTAKEWTDAVDFVYNRPGAEAMQFVIAAAFASPLVALINSNNWHGIPVAVTGDTGGGKSTICKIAAGIYGNPSRLTIGTTKAGANMTPLYIMSALAKNVPLVYDELSERDPSDLADMMYALSNGQPKLRGKPNGTLQKSMGSWDVIHFISSNNNINERLYQNRSEGADAVALRCFEIALDDKYIETHFGDINRKLIEETLLNGNYGLVGRIYLQFIIKNIDTVRATLSRARYGLESNPENKGRDRFYLDLLACVIVAGSLATHLGLLRFDMHKVKAWAMEHMIKLHRLQADMRAKPDELFARMVSDLNGRIVVSQHFYDGRQRVENVITPRLPPAARICMKDEVAYVSLKWFNTWCQENNMSPRLMRAKLKEQGVLVANSTLPQRISLGRGTDYPSAQETALEISFSKIMPVMEVGEPADGVVPLHQKKAAA